MLTNEELDSLRAEKVVYDPAWTEVFEQAKTANALRGEVEALREQLDIYSSASASAAVEIAALRTRLDAAVAKARLADEVRYAYRSGQEIADDWPDRYDEVSK